MDIEALTESPELVCVPFVVQEVEERHLVYG